MIKVPASSLRYKCQSNYSATPVMKMGECFQDYSLIQDFEADFP